MVYLFGLDAGTVAPAYSLFIVGAASFIGAIFKYKEGFVEFKKAMVFGLPTVVSIYFTRNMLVSALPDVFFNINGVSFTKPMFVMGLFATLMIIASITMIKGRKELQQNQPKKMNYPLILFSGLFVGVITGLVGAGGGFIIIPALIILSNTPMKKAVGTSLVIIVMNSFFGFLGSVNTIDVDWKLLLVFTAFSITGIFIGNKLSHRINGSKLKKGFGWMVLLMGSYLLIKEIFLN